VVREHFTGGTYKGPLYNVARILSEKHFDERIIMIPSISTKNGRADSPTSGSLSAVFKDFEK
jgi:hypothetical protein